MTWSFRVPLVHCATRTVQDRAYRALVLAGVVGAFAAAAAHAAGPGAAPAWWPAIARAPLDPPLAVTGDFGEYRTGHFHAGLDFSTGGVTGQPAYACLDGEIVRVRASGVGYGRSLYLQARDGRLLVYGHLDAFDSPLAEYVSAAQESTGQYEQDLWPATGRFPVKAGQRLAWTGNSGAGGPHFHFEIRRADMAYNPARAGLAWDDTVAPRLDAVTLEPLDERSYVERSPAPRRLALGARPDTVLVEGRVRAILDAYDPAASGDAMAPWSTEVEWDGARTAVVFDSVSWADGMSEIDYVYDRGRATDQPRRALTPWASAAARPRVVRGDAPAGEEAGTLVMRPGDPPREARFVARDLAGHVIERTLVLRGPRAGERGPDSTRVGGGGGRPSITFAFDPLPGDCVRVRVRGALAGSRGVTIAWGGAASASTATPMVAAGASFVAVVRAVAPDTGSMLSVHGRDAAGREWTGKTALLRADALARSSDREGSFGPGLGWRGLAAAQFEPGVVVRRDATTADAPAELAPVSPAFALEPTLTPLRKAFAVVLPAPSHPPSARVGVYQDDGSGWSWVRSTYDSLTACFSADVRRLGRFALLEDRGAPRVTLRAAPRRAAPGAYSRWALEARAGDDGSGIDGRESRFVVDGRAVPTEWDAEEGVLRWKPTRPPAPGAHRFEVIAVDRAGNRRRATGRFVLD